MLFITRILGTGKDGRRRHGGASFVSFACGNEVTRGETTTCERNANALRREGDVLHLDGPREGHVRGVHECVWRSWAGLTRDERCGVDAHDFLHKTFCAAVRCVIELCLSGVRSTMAVIAVVRVRMASDVFSRGSGVELQEVSLRRPAAAIFWACTRELGGLRCSVCLRRSIRSVARSSRCELRAVGSRR